MCRPPRLQLFRDGQVIAANTGLATSPDAAEIATVSAQVGAFAVPPPAPIARCS